MHCRYQAAGESPGGRRSRRGARPFVCWNLGDDRGEHRCGGGLGIQLLGVLVVGAFTFGFSSLIWWGLKKTVGVRVSARVEQLGQDVAELGIDAYPEFVLMPEQSDEDDEAPS